MGFNLAGITIETPDEARKYAKRCRRMASEIDTPDAPDEAKAKARELRQRADAAYRWARQHEQAIDEGHKAAAAAGHEPAHDDNVTPLHKHEPGQLKGLGGTPMAPGPRAAAHAAYHRARPTAMRLGSHVFQGAAAPFGPVSSSADTIMEAIGMTLAVVLIADLLRAPGALVDASSHGLGFLNRAAGLVDPLTGIKVAAAGAPAAARRAATVPAAHTATGKPLF